MARDRESYVYFDHEASITASLGIENSKLKVLVFEQWEGGHYFNYLECLIPRLAQLADRVVVCMTKRAGESEQFNKRIIQSLSHYENIEFDFSVEEALPSLPMGQKLFVANNLVKAIGRVRPDYTFIPSGDAQLQGIAAMSLAGVGKVSNLGPIEATFHFGYGFSAANFHNLLKEFVYSAAYRGCPYQYLNFVNFAYYEYAKSKGVKWLSRAKLVGDPVPQGKLLSRESARKLLGVEVDGRYAGLIGSLDSRKAIPELLHAFRRAKLGAKDRLLLAGRLNPSYDQLIRDEYSHLVRDGRLIVLNRFMTDDELSFGYAALDLACPVYYNFPGLASLMLKGLAARRPALVNDFGWSRSVVKRFDVGFSADIANVERFAEELEMAFEAAPAFELNEAALRLLKFHEVSNFTELMVERLGEMVGSRPGVETSSWEWVMEALPPDRRSIL